MSEILAVLRVVAKFPFIPLEPKLHLVFNRMIKFCFVIKTNDAE